jgi:hypothetical protein
VEEYRFLAISASLYRVRAVTNFQSVHTGSILYFVAIATIAVTASLMGEELFAAGRVGSRTGETLGSKVGRILATMCEFFLVPPAIFRYIISILPRPLTSKT